MKILLIKKGDYYDNLHLYRRYDEAGKAAIANRIWAELDAVSKFYDKENKLVVKAKDTLSLNYPYGKQTKKRGGV